MHTIGKVTSNPFPVMGNPLPSAVTNAAQAFSRTVSTHLNTGSLMARVSSSISAADPVSHWEAVCEGLNRSGVMLAPFRFQEGGGPALPDADEQEKGHQVTAVSFFTATMTVATLASLASFPHS